MSTTNTIFFTQPTALSPQDWEKMANAIYRWHGNARNQRLRALYVLAVMAAREIVARAEIFGGNDEGFFPQKDFFDSAFPPPPTKGDAAR